MNPTAAFDLALANDLAEIERLNTAMAIFLEQQEIPPKAGYTINLALEEMITNIIKYGYDDDQRHEIRVGLTLDGDRLTLRVEDDGHEFDPLAVGTPDTHQPIQDREIGGLGIYLVRSMTERMAYRREGGRNVLEIVIRRHDDPPPPPPPPGGGP